MLRAQDDKAMSNYLTICYEIALNNYKPHTYSIGHTAHCFHLKSWQYIYFMLSCREHSKTNKLKGGKFQTYKCMRLISYNDAEEFSFSRNYVMYMLCICYVYVMYMLCICYVYVMYMLCIC